MQAAPVSLACKGKCELQQFPEFFYAETRLSYDRPQRAGLEVAAGMHRHRYRPRRIARIRKDMVAADYSIDNKSRPLQGANDRSAACNGEASVRHS